MITCLSGENPPGFLHWHWPKITSRVFVNVRSFTWNQLLSAYMYNTQQSEKHAAVFLSPISLYIPTVQHNAILKTLPALIGVKAFSPPSLCLSGSFSLHSHLLCVLLSVAIFSSILLSSSACRVPSVPLSSRLSAAPLVIVCSSHPSFLTDLFFFCLLFCFLVCNFLHTSSASLPSSFTSFSRASLFSFLSSLDLLWLFCICFEFKMKRICFHRHASQSYFSIWAHKYTSQKSHTYWVFAY